MIIKTDLYLDINTLFLHTLIKDDGDTEDSINNDLVSMDIRNYKCWEPYQTEIIVELLKKLNNKYFIHLGAHIGYFSLICASYGFNVKSYERRKEYYKILEMNVIKNKNINISNEDIYKNNVYKIFKDISNLGLVKLNMAGNEPEIIYGMKNYIENDKIDCIIIEISPKYRPIEIWKDLIVFLLEKYKVYDIGLSPPRSLDFNTNHLSTLILFDLKLIETLDQTNILCIRNNLN